MSERERRFEYLDWMRGVAAVLVLTYHARLLFFSDWGAGGGSGGWAARLFYFITGFGHLAVVVFFVLSGCVIAHVVLPRLERADWSWSDYLLARVARFWTVLLPGLVLTLVWDWWGWKWFPGSLTHTATRYANLLTPADVEHLSVIHFLGNLFSLQTILVPCYGSNGALWSLACEFWYYCFFPALALLFLPAQLSLGTRLITALVAVVALLMIGGETARLFPVWLMGVAAYVLARRIPPSAGPGQMWGTAVTFLITAGVLSFVRVKATAHAMPWWDYIAGGCVAVLIYFLLSQSPRVHGAISRILHETAGSSFTLYVAHTPILALVATVVMDQRAERWPLTLGYFGCYLVIVAGVYVYAWLLAAVTERYTHRVRDLLRRWVGTDGVTAARGGK